MGRPKLLLPWGATTVLGSLLTQWEGLGSAQTLVVSAPNQPDLQAELHRLGRPTVVSVINPSPELGMFSSIQVAAGWTGWLPRLSHCAIVLGDQPHLRSRTLQRVLEVAAQAPGSICQPSRAGRPRHPVLLPMFVMAQLASSRKKTLRDFLAAWPVTLCEVDDPGLEVDLDSPADYEQALVRFGTELPVNAPPGTAAR